MGIVLIVKNADFSQSAVESVIIGKQEIEWNYPGHYCGIPNSTITIGTTVWDFEENLHETESGTNCAILNCSPGDRFEVTHNASYGVVPFCFVDENNIVLDFKQSTSASGTYTVVAPTGATKVMIQSRVTAYYL